MSLREGSACEWERQTGFTLRERERERERNKGMPLPMLAVACNGKLEGMIFLKDQIMAMEVGVWLDIKKRFLVGRGNWLGSVWLCERFYLVGIFYWCVTGYCVWLLRKCKHTKEKLKNKFEDLKKNIHFHYFFN